MTTIPRGLLNVKLIEPPCTERYARWCERSANQLMISLLLDWAEGYYVSTVGLNEATIKKYIQEQEKHDIAMDKLSVKEYEDPFKG